MKKMYKLNLGNSDIQYKFYTSLQAAFFWLQTRLNKSLSARFGSSWTVAKIGISLTTGMPVPSILCYSDVERSLTKQNRSLGVGTEN